MVAATKSVGTVAGTTVGKTVTNWRWFPVFVASEMMLSPGKYEDGRIEAGLHECQNEEGAPGGRDVRLKMHVVPAFLHLLQGKSDTKCPFRLTWSSAVPPGVKTSSGPSVMKHRTFWS